MYYVNNGLSNGHPQHQGSFCESCLTCSMKCASLFHDMTQEQLKVIDEHRSVVVYKAGEHVFKEGSRPGGLLCLSHGKVKISMTGENGNELITSLKKPVDFLGFGELISGKPHTSSAYVLEDATICVVTTEAFMSVCKESTDLMHKINLYLVNDLDKTRERMTSLTQKHMRARMADALLFVHSVYGENVIDQSLDVALKRSDLAALSNMTTANAIRTLSELSKEGVIRSDKRKIHILSMPQLRAISLQG